MKRVRLVCLGFSHREGGYCLAGVVKGTTNWIRPIQNSAMPQLHLSGYIPKLLDIIELPLASAAPEPHQPENWVLGEGRWNVLGSLPPAEALGLLTKLSNRRPELFRNSTDRIACADVAANSLSHSLTIVRPKELLFRFVWGARGQKQLRCSFNMNGHPYDLSVTDAAFIGRLNHIRVGSSCSLADAGCSTSAQVFLAASLTGAFGNSYYKLIAGVLPLDNHGVLQ